MINNIGEPHLEEIRKLMANFYEQIKSANSILRFTMMTGVTRFAKVSIFSALNYIKDLTMSRACATMLGYTQVEVEYYFGERIAELAQEQDAVPAALFLAKVKEWSNGFCFSDGTPTLYNPVSLGSFIQEEGCFSNYWFETGSPNYIFRILKEKHLNFFDTIIHPLTEAEFDTFDPLEMEVAPLLLQSGYLTIKDYESRMGERF